MRVSVRASRAPCPCGIVLAGACWAEDSRCSCGVLNTGAGLWGRVLMLVKLCAWGIRGGGVPCLRVGPCVRASQVHGCLLRVWVDVGVCLGNRHVEVVCM